MAFALNNHHAQISDRHGNQYTLRVEGNGFSVRILLAHRHKLVGIAQCVINSPDTLTLADITIYDRVPTHENTLTTAYRLVFRRAQPTVSYRGHGLGSALLEHVKDYAREHGFERITGLARSDDTPRRDLFRWYRRHGFTVDETGKFSLSLDT